jgi:DNA-binding MarR family transcriptional regulator
MRRCPSGILALELDNYGHFFNFRFELGLARAPSREYNTFCGERSEPNEVNKVSGAHDQLADALQAVFRCWVEATRRQDRQHDMPLMALLVLGTIKKEPGITVSELARRLGIAKSHGSDLVDGLTQKELVTKEADPDDRRLLRLVLSAKGQDLIAEGEASIRQRLLAITADVPEELANRLATDLQALQAIIARNRCRAGVS